MIKQKKVSKFKKVVAIYLAIMILLETFQPTQIYALTSGPTQPEFNAFTPIGTSDMVNLSTGDFNYNIPIMDVGGYPLNLAYNSGATMDQESSWVGLGWNLNVGEISRQVRGLPDDFRGDKMTYENNLRDNVTVGTNFNVSGSFFGVDIPIALGLGVQYNNYEGVTFKPSVGVSYSLFNTADVGFTLTGSTGDGATLSPSVGISGKVSEKGRFSSNLGVGFGVDLNNRKGLENMSVSITSKRFEKTLQSGGNDVTQKIGEGSIKGNISLNNTNNYTPTKRVAYDNINGVFNATLGSEIFGGELQGRITAYGAIQKINSKYKNRSVAAYGYENGQYKNDTEGVLDFNREKEQGNINKNTNALPVTNYTYDVYNIEGQGVSGMFRPFKSQTTYVYNDKVTDRGSATALGAEIGGGNLVHVGVNFSQTPSSTEIGKWNRKNNAINAFTERATDKNDPLYEPTTFKLVGELDVDNELDNLYNKKMLGNRPLRLKIGGGSFNRTLESVYMAKPISKTDLNYEALSVKSPIKRSGRLLRNQSIQKITNKEADDKFIFKNNAANSHHTAGMKVLQTDGTTYVYGKAVYNSKKIEASFDVSAKEGNNYKGTVPYVTPLDRNGNNNSDEYVSKTTTPAYAHTYLITSVLSPEYQDIDNNGPSDNDLGTYTKFDYTKSGDTHYTKDFKWRVPYEKNTASYNEGLKTSKKDQRGNYLYGEKEVTYLKKIETKTHVAFIDLEKRKDAMGVTDEQGGLGSDAMSYIKSIRLFSKSELVAANITLETAANVGNTISVKPIKTAHFEYDYSLCSGIPSNNNTDASLGKGKLTLKKLYFTYRSSNMGKYTPYKFDYSEVNPNYDIKASDIWGNFKENIGNAPLTPAEFPFVEQNSTLATENTSAWQLQKITLPSGGELKIQTESDDYKYVQNKKAMQMFKVIGAGNSIDPTSSNTLFNGKTHQKYIYVNIPDATLSADEFKQKYLSENINKPIYFRFLLNMIRNKTNSAVNKNSDFVSGYFEIDNLKLADMTVNNHTVAIPLKFLKLDGISGDKNRLVNPIAKAGWGFGRTYLNRNVYSQSEEDSNKNFESIARDLVKSIESMAQIFKSPNAILETNGCAQTFVSNSSWIRLENPNGKKLGGGLRVSKIELSDQWNIMNSIETNPIYNEKYGQQYSYVLEDGTSSSGVATFEPNASSENPFVGPFYGDSGNYADKIAAPKEINYIETPFGESFFPSAKVTYSRVTVSNLEKTGNGNKVIKKHATGKVVTEFYTTKDFPTLVDYTDLNILPDPTADPILQTLDIKSVNHLAASQGFSIETNDMDGKVKSENVFAEGQSKPISKVEYKYNVGKDGKLDNNLTTINSKGRTTIQQLGVNYDLVNDFNESFSTSKTYGADGNLASFLVAIFPCFVPTILPRFAYHESVLRTSTTTKVVHKTGILIEKIAYDLGSKVSTKNLAWDAKTGQVILTKTINEFDDNYYNFTYPAYWSYDNMGLASDNLGLEGYLVSDGAYFDLRDYSTTDISKYFKIGDELVFKDTKLWVIGYKSNTDKSRIQLMDRDGSIIDATNKPSDLQFKIMRSGNKNLQMSGMASVTSMHNPIENNRDITNATFGYLAGSNFDKKVLNASAVEYSDDWKSQCENGLPSEAGLIAATGAKINPYLYNTKGNWRALRSYAYLTGRNNHVTTNRRKTGYFASFNPFYQLSSGTWFKDVTNWTSASEVTKYSPYGSELENKDALERYSSAQYGYNYTLPVAVVSNAKYGEIGFDGFEDYGIPNPQLDALLNPHFGFAQAVNTNVKVSKTVSHTGNNSIAISPGQRASFVRKINGCKVATPPAVTSYPFLFSNSGNTSVLACSQTTFPIKLYASTPTIAVNTILYTDAKLTIPAASENLWYQLGVNKTPYRIDNNGKITESYYCNTGGGSTTTSSIGITPLGITDHFAPYADGGNFNWSNFYADIYLNTSGANLNVGDTLTIEFQVTSSFTPLHYGSVQYPNNGPENFTALPIYAVTSKTITYDGTNNTIRINLAIPLSQIQNARTQTSASIKLAKINGVVTTFKSGASGVNIITPATGGITYTLN